MGCALCGHATEDTKGCPALISLRVHLTAQNSHCPTPPHGVAALKPTEGLMSHWKTAEIQAHPALEHPRKLLLGRIFLKRGDYTRRSPPWHCFARDVGQANQSASIQP